MGTLGHPLAAATGTRFPKILYNQQTKKHAGHRQRRNRCSILNFARHSMSPGARCGLRTCRLSTTRREGARSRASGAYCLGEFLAVCVGPSPLAFHTIARGKELCGMLGGIWAGLRESSVAPGHEPSSLREASCISVVGVAKGEFSLATAAHTAKRPRRPPSTDSRLREASKRTTTRQ